MFNSFIFLIVSAANAGEIKTQTLKIEESIEVQQLEISGLAWRNFNEKNQELILIGDRKYEFGIINWNQRKKSESYQKVNEFKSAGKLKKNSQWEALASDSSRSLYALQ